MRARDRVDSVVFLIDYFHPFEVGGAERSARMLGRELARAGLRVLVATPNYGAPARERIDGLDVVRLPFPQRLQPGRLARRLWSANPLLQLAYGALIARLIRKEAVALVHVQNSPMMVAGAVAARLTRRPLVVTVRDLGYVTLDGRPAYGPVPAVSGVKHRVDAMYARIERRLKRRAAGAARRVVFVSEGLRQVYLADRSSAPMTSRAAVVYNIGPEAVAAPRPRSSEPIVLFVGKLSAGKGLQVLYEAIPAISSRVPGVKFVFVGERGTGWTAPPPQAAGSVVFKGRLPENAVAAEMDGAAVLVSPSLWPEPLSRVLLEAMSRALPIVATTVGGTTEAVDDESAALVPPHDAAALANAIVRVLQDPVMADRLRRAALDRYRRTFTREQVVPEILDVYESAV